jgi:hypothetical protein
MRAKVGTTCIETAAGHDYVCEEDRETYAADAISDILTALFGPAGTHDADCALVEQPFAIECR